MLPEVLVAEVLRFGDAFDAARCAIVGKPWRDAFEADELWEAWYRELALAEVTHDELVRDGWGHTRSGVYRGPLKHEDFDAGQTEEELAYQRTPKNAVVALFNLYHTIATIADEWRDNDGARRSPPAGTVVAPLPRVSLAAQSDWRRRLQRASRGAVVERSVLEALAVFGGSRRWSAEAGIALRLFTFEEIEAFLDSGGREPDGVLDRTDQAPLRDKGDWAHGWIEGGSRVRWIPVADLAVSTPPRAAPPLDDRDEGVATMVVLMYTLPPDSDASDASDGSDISEDIGTELGYVAQVDGDLFFHMAPFVNLFHFLQVSEFITDDPFGFLFDEHPQSDVDSESSEWSTVPDGSDGSESDPSSDDEGPLELDGPTPEELAAHGVVFER